MDRVSSISFFQPIQPHSVSKTIRTNIIASIYTDMLFTRHTYLAFPFFVQ